MDKKLRYSRQRETIYEILKNDCTHPNVDDIYMQVKKVIPDISLGTVYRNLNLLASQNKILKLDIGDGAIHFDARITPHYHLVCDKCGVIEDIFLDEEIIAPLITQVQDNCDMLIDSAEILFHGECHNCLKKN
ncbi:MAG: transcriptional repressor [Erysipelotrichales bacterium]|nr:transcriptional repressor [Erysipelotrichales bacterium]